MAEKVVIDASKAFSWELMQKMCKEIEEKKQAKKQTKSA